ncbi:Piwi-like protein Siwi [Amphibalanus amphitrite]|uniref:Piwi-like protein Siwi n=1 Tax=Amphibalanus amphitrite TaxID=1232801 RepID=A0A6A4V7J7_AMPAM|nr:Piwi-like protein Siwi [Amphibalanus amphitrite]
MNHAGLTCLFRLVQELELLSVKESDGSKVRILIKFTHEVPPMDHQFINIFNIITNQCMSLIGYTKLRKQDREFFDMKQAQSADRGQLEIWPGYGAAVNQFEHNVLMCVSVSHKVLRMDSVLNQLSSIQRQFPRDARAAAERRLLGCIVMCRHNLRMYKIDEIMWDKTPAAEFDYKGTRIPLAKYYQEKHNITVSMDQPLLLSNPKRREMRQGQTEPFWLVPELCNMTGLSDEMRNNNNLMKELSGFLNMPPQQRAQKLHQFSTRLNSSEDVKSLLSFWGLKFSRELLKVNGRVLPNEKVKTNRETEARDGSWNDAVKTMDKTQMEAKEEEHVMKPSDPGMDAAQRAAKEKELASLRRQRGFKRAAVTRISKTVEEEIARQASSDSIQKVNLRLEEAFADLRKVQQTYESLIDDEEIEDAQEYADRLEEEDARFGGRFNSIYSN